MTKVAYNACYGGFGLSTKAVIRYAELKNLKVYPDVHRFYTRYSLSPPTGNDDIDAKRKFFDEDNIERDDPILIQVIEELGNEANGQHASLQIEDVPTGAAYRIESYDGTEQVMTVNDYKWKKA